MEMLNIIKYKTWYFVISLLVIIPGFIALSLWGLTLSIDFTGGTRIIYLSETPVGNEDTEKIRTIFSSEGVEVSTIQVSGNQVIVRTDPIDDSKNTEIEKRVEESGLSFRLDQFETIGPTIGQETTLNAVKAIAVASLLIILYIAWSFRKVPRPTTSWRFGITTIVTLLHDVLVLLGIFAILGHFFDVEIDSLFITALLTVMGFSVHDTIVIYDRIRENLIKGKGGTFAQVVNDSILQTMTRSLNTSVTTLIVLFGLFLFGGESIRWFVVALILGIFVGTYSSIFNAAPLLVLWDEVDRRWKKRKAAK